MPTLYHMNPVEWLVFLAASELRQQDSETWLALDRRVREGAGCAVAYGMSCWRAATIDLGPLIEALEPTN